MSGHRKTKTQHGVKDSPARIKKGAAALEGLGLASSLLVCSLMSECGVVFAGLG